MPNRVSSSYVRILYDYLEARGLDAEVMLARPAPAPDATGHSYVDLHEMISMFDMADQALSEPALGLKVGSLIKPHHIGLLGYLLSNCRNVAHAMYRHNEFERLYWDAPPSKIRPELFGVRIMWPPVPGNTSRVIEECNLAAYVTFARNISGCQDENPGDIHFTFPAPASRSCYEDFFRCPVRFDAPFASVSVSWINLLRPLVAPDENLQKILELQATERLARIPLRNDFLDNLRSIISSQLIHQQADLERCSEKLNCSTRTLQRRLDEMGTSFQEELDRTRHDLAESYLADPGLKISELSLMLGYAEQSAFTRAFKRWTDTSPAHWRKQRIRLN